MATPVEIINEKTKAMKSLWESNRMEELVSTLYAPDAYISDRSVLYNGHDEILKACKIFQGTPFEINSAETSSPTDDCVTQTLAGTWEGNKREGKITWNNVNGDWKITREEWN